jgi:hypothetical protein
MLAYRSVAGSYPMVIMGCTSANQGFIVDCPRERTSGRPAQVAELERAARDPAMSGLQPVVAANVDRCLFGRRLHGLHRVDLILLTEVDLVVARFKCLESRRLWIRLPA